MNLPAHKCTSGIEMVDKKMLTTLVDDKKNLDRASRDIEVYRNMYIGDGGTGNPNVTGDVLTVDETHRVFDDRVAALTEDQR